MALEAVTLEATAKRSEYYPRFFVEGGYNYLAINMLFMTAPGLVMGGMSINLFSGGQRRLVLIKSNEKDKLTIEREETHRGHTV